MIQEPTWPGITLFSVTKSDATIFSPAIRQIYVGGAGDVTVVTSDDVTVTFTSVPAGATIGPFFVKQIKSTGTTATNMVAFV